VLFRVLLAAVAVTQRTEIDIKHRLHTTVGRMRSTRVPARFIARRAPSVPVVSSVQAWRARWPRKPPASAVAAWRLHSSTHHGSRPWRRGHGSAAPWSPWQRGARREAWARPLGRRACTGRAATRVASPRPECKRWAQRDQLCGRGCGRDVPCFERRLLHRPAQVEPWLRVQLLHAVRLVTKVALYMSGRRG